MKRGAPIVVLCDCVERIPGSGWRYKFVSQSGAGDAITLYAGEPGVFQAGALYKVGLEPIKPEDAL